MDGAAIAVFRIGFGIILFIDIIRYGWVLCMECYYLDPQFLFKYYGFEWVQPWPGKWLYWHHAALAVCAAGITLGLYYRTCIILFTLGFSYLFLLDQARYLNHFYMVILFCSLLCVVPAHRLWSLDALRKPEIASQTLPFWCKVLLAGQLEIILVYAGLVKINWDWLNLEPLRMWLEKRSDLPFLGEYFLQDWSIAVAAYGVIALHLIGAPLLFVKGVRWIVLCTYAAFHILNHFVFSIGIFPWMTLFASMLCFEPDWPRRLYRFTQRLKVKFLFQKIALYEWIQVRPSLTINSTISTQQKWIINFVIVWLLLQCLIPLRHHLYPGNVAWNEEGHRFSWRMKLRSKKGIAEFTVIDNLSQETWKIDNSDFLTKKQRRKMRCNPDLILQYAHYLEKVWAEEEGYTDVAIYADVKCGLNSRRYQPMLDSSADLTEKSRTLSYRDWVIPLDEPLPTYFLPETWSQ